MERQLVIVYRKLAELIPSARNARTHSEQQVLQIAASMKEWGFTNPVLIDEHDGIIAGHGRVLAAPRIGLEEAPTITLRGLSEAQKAAYMLADNKLALNAGWDQDMLQAELERLNELEFDLALTGFSDSDLNAILASAADAEPPPPEAFNEYDEGIEVNQQCPKCGYEWSDPGTKKKKG